MLVVAFHHKDFFLSTIQKALLWHCFYLHTDKTSLQWDYWKVSHLLLDFVLLTIHEKGFQDTSQRPKLLCVPVLASSPFDCPEPIHQFTFWCSARRKKANWDCSPQIWDCMVPPGASDIFIRGATLAASRRREFNICLVSSGIELHPFC